MCDSGTILGRRGFLLGGISMLGAAAGVAKPASAAVSAAPGGFLVEQFRQASDPDDTLCLTRALAAARAAGGGRVIAAPGRVYRVSPSTTFVSLNPSGGTCRYNVCLQLPAGVTLDMQGSTIQLQGSIEAVLVANANVTGTAPRDRALGLTNVVLDGRNVRSTYHSLLHLGHLDALTLTSVKIIRGTLQGGWIYDCTSSVFDDLEVDGFIGEPWSIGAPQGKNQVFDSHIGRLKATNVAKIDSSTLPGNSFVLYLVRCTVQSIDASKCSAGVKLEWPSTDVSIGTVTVDTCGDQDGNSGFKIQGDPTQGGIARRVTVQSVVARNQAGPGLFMEHCIDCSVTAFSGVGNNTNGNSADVWIGGTNDHVGSISSDASGGNGVLIRPYATGYQLPKVVVLNAGRTAASGNKAGVGVYGGSGGFGGVVCVDNQPHPTMTRGVDVNSPSAVGRIGSLTASGLLYESFKSVSPNFLQPPPPASPPRRPLAPVAATRAEARAPNRPHAHRAKKRRKHGTSHRRVAQR